MATLQIANLIKDMIELSKLNRRPILDWLCLLTIRNRIITQTINSNLNTFMMKLVLKNTFSMSLALLFKAQLMDLMCVFLLMAKLVVEKLIQWMALGKMRVLLRDLFDTFSSKLRYYRRLDGSIQFRWVSLKFIMKQWDVL